LCRSIYHPEKFLELWGRVSTDVDYQHENEVAGFNFAEKAVNLRAGWIYNGDRFIEDFLEVETTLGVELLFPNPPATERLPAFQEFKHKKTSGENLTKPS